MRTRDENFNIIDDIQVDPKEIEKKIHDALNDLKVRQIEVTKKLPFFAEDKKHDWAKGKKP